MHQSPGSSEISALGALTGPQAGQNFGLGGLGLTGTGRGGNYGVLAGQLGSLLVGHYDDDGTLHYAGRVGSGIGAAARDDLEARLAPLARKTSPFAEVPALPDPRWVTPKLVVEVEFHEWTRAGVMRAPRYKGRRTDKPAREVRRES